MARYRLMEWLNFITSELHKAFTPLFTPGTPAATKKQFSERVLNRLTWVDSQLEGKAFLTGDTFTVADAYLYTVTGWTQFVGIDISGLKHLGAFMGRVSARPAVQAALKAEGLSK
jgi:glutathione S-transferase